MEAAVAQLDEYDVQQVSAEGHRHPQTGPWNTRAVLTVLRNRVYLGEIYYRGVWNTGPTGPFHPPLVNGTNPALTPKDGVREMSAWVGLIVA